MVGAAIEPSKALAGGPGENQMAKIRLNIEVTQELVSLLDGLADLEGTTRSELVRRGISVLKAYHEQREIGRPHLGFTKDPQRLDAEMLGILSSPTHVAAPRPQTAQPALVSAPAPQIRPVAPIGPAPVSMEIALSRWTVHQPHAVNMKG
jgi:Ribbon-helix-helix protein, copG family